LVLRLHGSSRNDCLAQVQCQSGGLDITSWALTAAPSSTSWCTTGRRWEPYTGTACLICG